MIVAFVVENLKGLAWLLISLSSEANRYLTRVKS